MPRIRVAEIIETLSRTYGEPKGPPSLDPFHLILWEQVAYLADDARRLEAYRLLEKATGLRPEAIAAAPRSTLLRVARHGGAIAAEDRASRLKESAVLVLSRFGGDLRAALRRLPVAGARKALRDFPMIGEPGADRILLLTRTAPLFAVESNGLRVLLRLGFGTEHRDYRRSYQSVMTAMEGDLPSDYEGMISAHLLLRLHGQEMCKRTKPVCSTCPLHPKCDYAIGLRS
jgi:endonuclease III